MHKDNTKNTARHANPPQAQTQTFTKETVKARKYTSELVGILAATLERTKPKLPSGSDFPFEDEALRMYLTLIELARRAEIQAEQNRAEPEELRRFFCPDYVAELTYRREILPYELPREERKKIEQKLGRAWRDRFKRVIHERQCRNHLNFFEREKRESKAKRLATTYIDRMTDFLNFSLKLMREEMKRGVPVKRAKLAVEKSLREFIAKPECVYAPEWTEPEAASGATPEKPDGDATTEKKADPFVSIERKLKRCVRATRKLAEKEELSEDEKEIVRAKLHALIESEWTDAPRPEGAPRPRRSFSRSPVLSKDNIAEKLAPWLSEIIHPSAEPRAPAQNLDRCSTAYLNSDEMQICSGNLAFAPKVLSQKCTFSADEATLAVEAFESVGCKMFKAVFVGIYPLTGEAEKLGSEPKQNGASITGAEIKLRLPEYIKRNQEQNHNVALRAWGAIIQVDDCTAEIMERLKPFAFLITETSPGNYQVWLALPKSFTGADGKISEQGKALRTRLLKKFEENGEFANGGAYGSTRLPGTFNVKEKYQGSFPQICVVYVAPSRIVAPEELEQSGLLADAPAPPVLRLAESPRYTNSNLPTGWPDYQFYVSRAPLKEDGQPNLNSADESFVVRCLALGHPRYSVGAKLRTLRDKAANRADYVERTLNAAESWLASQPVENGRERITI
jgi:hypothetical protein